MNVALENQNTYDEFVLEKDILYFRVGAHGLVSFHGKNFNVKRRLSTEQLDKMLSDSAFFKVNTDCYANLHKVEAVQDSRVCFDSKSPTSKSVSITKLRQGRLKGFLNHHEFERNLNDTLK
ncbi:LytTR family transcriptional regulator DNA-binding domain-containing protein [Paenibacillus eucommiae]|uniref:HTH LytTR-type domain-containing protein n=1 Tax=Paenibacillus eucommiae TaxID=1355755 RepID=A0ABS4J742_9BACL|nr:LytTR family transcriptional regulator DNA-binding domain-containing protein [Paenibacillus eucommiae]MBP1995660.1 hypothetical protein [Paenibacillus eucommiae]